MLEEPLYAHVNARLMLLAPVRLSIAFYAALGGDGGDGGDGGMGMSDCDVNSNSDSGQMSTMIRFGLQLGRCILHDA